MGWLSNLRNKGARKGDKAAVEAAPRPEAPDEAHTPWDSEGQDQIVTVEGTTAITEEQADASGDDPWSAISKEQQAIQVAADLKMATTDSRKKYSPSDSADFWAQADLEDKDE